MLNGTAYMRQPWPQVKRIKSSRDNYRGLLFIQPEQLHMVVEEAARRGWQMTAHTAGEGAMDVLLDAYELVNRQTPIKERRFCITHANFPSQRNLERCRRLGVCADVQPAWLWKDGTTLLKVLGEDAHALVSAVQDVAAIHDHRRWQRPHDQARLAPGDQSVEPLARLCGLLWPASQSAARFSLRTNASPASKRFGSTRSTTPTSTTRRRRKAAWRSASSPT